MDRRAKFRKLAITAGMTLGIFSGLLGFAVGAKKAQGGGAAGFGFVVALFYFIAVFGTILLIYKVFDHDLNKFLMYSQVGMRYA